MEHFKSFDTLLIEDERQKYFSRPETVPWQYVPFTLHDIYNEIESINLDVAVPADVHSQFNIAKMLAVFSWFYYPFHQISELKTYSTVEYALRNRFGENKKGLKLLLQRAVDEGLINNSALPEIIAGMRNDLAHGSTTLSPKSVDTLRRCADVLNGLFRQINLTNRSTGRAKKRRAGELMR